MTSIGSTSYANIGLHYSAAAKSNAPNVEPETTKQKSTDKSEGAGNLSALDRRSSNATLGFQGRLLALEGPIGRGADLKPLHVSELPEAQYKQFMEGEQRRIEANEYFLLRQYSNHDEMPDLSNYAGTKPYATVTVGGKVVATIDNQGVMTTSDALYDRVRGKLPDSGNAGPDLAQGIADAIARVLGGRVEKAPTALSQRQFNAMPFPEKPELKIDYDAMKTDPMYTQIQRSSENYARIERQRAEYLAKQQSGVNISV
jgi:hypothetical protein